jgi:hypothetical protein
MESTQTIHTQYVVVFRLFSHHSTPPENLKIGRHLGWRKTSGTRYFQSGNFLMVPLPHVIEADPLLEPLCRHPIWRRGRFCSQRTVLAFFSRFHSHGFLRIPLAVFLSIPLPNNAYCRGFFSPFHWQKILYQSHSDWLIGR